MRITEEVGPARSIQKQMEHFQGTGMRADDGILKFSMLCEFAGILNMGKGMVLKMHFMIINFTNENIFFSLPISLVMHILMIFLPF